MTQRLGKVKEKIDCSGHVLLFPGQKRYMPGKPHHDGNLLVFRSICKNAKKPISR